MIDLKNIAAEYKISTAFGVLALVFSLFTGIITGISYSVVILRSFITLIFFAGLGYGVSQVVKRFVPEFYELFSKGTSVSAGDMGPEDVSVDQEFEDEEGGDSEQNAEVASETSRMSSVSDDILDDSGDKGISEFRETDFTVPGDATVAEQNSSLNIQEGKLGKHLISDREVFNKYEPKIMAEAVRTMMSRNKE